MAYPPHLLFLDDLRLLCEELELSLFMFLLFAIDKLAAALVSTPRALNELAGCQSLFKAPLDPEHAHIGLDVDSCHSLLIPLLFGFTARKNHILS